MQSSNPVFTRAEGFNGKGGNGYAGFEPTSSTEYGIPSTHTEAGSGRMTIDSVVQKTALTLGVVILVGAATWILSGDLFTDDPLGGVTVNDDVATRLYTLSLIGVFGGFALSLVNSFKRVISPVLVIAYAAFEGLAVGAFSKVMEARFGDGLVVGAVLGTIAAVAGTLAAYKFFNIQVGTKFRKITVAAMFGFVGISFFDLILSFFNADIGINGFGPIGLLMSVVGLGIGIMLLIYDFDFVERGIAAGLPERESWRAAFGLTVTIVWIYIELLRLLAILRR